jgi:hypothetical protein
VRLWVVGVQGLLSFVRGWPDRGAFSSKAARRRVGQVHCPCHPQLLVRFGGLPHCSLNSLRVHRFVVVCGLVCELWWTGRCGVERRNSELEGCQ